MSADRAEALYRRLRLVFPAAWRRRYESEFLETLRDDASHRSTSLFVRVADLLGLALVLRWRSLSNRMSAVRDTGPPMLVLVLAALLLVPSLHWGSHAPLEFLVTSALVVLVPGIGVIYTVSAAVAGGRAAGLSAAFGCTLGIVPHLVLAFLGLSGLMQLGATVFEFVRWAGVAYLVWMGVGLLRDRGGLSFGPVSDGTISEPTKSRTLSIIVRGVVVNLLNPKLTAFFFAFLPQFVDAPPNSQATGIASAIDARLFGLGSLFMLLTLIGFVLYALAGAALRQWAGGTPSIVAWAQRTFGVLLLGFAARLAVAER